MNIVIIEDEALAARRLENMVLEFNPDYKIIQKLESVEDSAFWLNSNPQPDLIFIDIHLEDNISFCLFELVDFKSSIVFTTATDIHVTNYFKRKSIDFLLKPIIQTELNCMLEKYMNTESLMTEKVNNELKINILNLLHKRL